jgi:predicted HTH transcriptional regulator
LSEQLGKYYRTIERGIKKLKDSGIIEREGSKKTGKWIVKGK